MPGESVGGIDASVLASCTPKAHLQAVKPSFDIVFDGDVDDIVYTVEEFGHPGLLLQKIFYRLVPARERLEFIYPPRVEDAAAVEDKTAAVAAVIRRLRF